MTHFKYCCAILAVIYLVLALLPTNVINPHHIVIGPTPVWLGRAISIADFLLLATVFYGMHTRRPIYWVLIPILIMLYVLSILIPSLWTLVWLSLPWQPFIIVVVLFLIGMIVFCAWWRKQREYFT
jgi:hypothetical protein